MLRMISAVLFVLVALPAAWVAVPTAYAEDVPDLRTRKDGSDWPKFLGPTADSKSTETGIIKDWPATGPRIVWQKTLGDTRSYGYAAPTISKGRLFIFDRIRNLNRLRCVKSETGEKLWDYTFNTDYTDLLGYDGGPRCAPLVDDDRVYVIGAEGGLHCVSVVDGKRLWFVNTVETFGVVQNFFGVGASPVIEGDLLICQVGGSPQKPGTPTNIYEAEGKVDSNGTAIVAFNKHTGEVVYKTGDEFASYSTPTLATVHGKRRCFTLMRGGLLAFDPANGKIDFHFPWRSDTLESVNASNPAVIGDKVFISECYGPGAAMLQVKKEGGYEVVWQDEERGRKIMQTHWNTAIHHEGYLYGSSGRHSNADLRCIDAKTGEVMWSQPRLTRSQLLYVDGHFVVLTEHGHLLLVKATPDAFQPVAACKPSGQDKDGDGEPDALLEYPAWAAPVLSHGLLYARGKDRLVCWELIPKK